MLTGFWHGAAWNFVLWGLLFAVMLLLEKLVLNKWLSRLPRVISHGYVLLIVMISFVLFDASSAALAIERVASMFGGQHHVAIDGLSLYYLKSYGAVFAIAIFGATPIPKRMVERMMVKVPMKKAMVFVEPLVSIVLLVIVTAYLVDSTFNPFLYFRF